MILRFLRNKLVEVEPRPDGDLSLALEQDPELNQHQFLQNWSAPT